MLRRFLFFLFILALTVALTVEIDALPLYLEPPEAYYTDDFDIALTDVTLRHHQTTQQGFHYDGVRYEIYHVDDPAAPFLKHFSDAKSPALEAEVNEVLAPVAIAENQRIDWQQPYAWQKLPAHAAFDTLYLIYQPDAQILYVVGDYI